MSSLLSPLSLPNFHPALTPIPRGVQGWGSALSKGLNPAFLCTGAAPHSPSHAAVPSSLFCSEHGLEQATAGETMFPETPSSIATSVGAGSTSQRADFGSALVQSVANSAELYGSIWKKRSV